MAEPTTAAGRPFLRSYIAAVTALGCTVFAYCIAQLAGRQLPPEAWTIAALTFVTGRITLRVPSVEARFTVSEVFAFTSVLLFGPELGAATLALDSLVLAWQRRMRLERACFNFGTLALSVWASGALFFAVSGISPMFGGARPGGALILPLALLAASYFVLNTGLVAGAISLERGTNAVLLWRGHLMRLAPGYAASASLSLLLVVALQQVHFAAIALLPPLLLVFYYTLRSSFGRLEDAKGHLDKLNTLYLSTVETLATAIDAKDEVTHGHIRRVQLGAVALARRLGVHDAEAIKAIEAAALLHDTGKIAIPEHILNKPGKLTPAEFEKMKLHAPIGAEILSAIDFPYPVVPIVRHHHENWDGTGYPDGIRGTDIPIGARILSVVDCFDALTSDRPYRRRMTDADALRILMERRGTMYDPLVVDVFAASYQEIMPSEDAAAHPAARAVGGARRAADAATPAPSQPHAAAGPPAPADLTLDAPAMTDLLAISSVARAVAGTASIADVGALSWMAIRAAVPAASMALFVDDVEHDRLTVAYAAGLHAPRLRELSRLRGSGIAGWVAAHRRGVLNAEPGLDLGETSRALDPPLRSAVAVPLPHDGAIVGVLSCYATAGQGFSEDHQRLLEMLAPSLGASVAVVAGRSRDALNEPRPVPGRRDGTSNVVAMRR